MPKKILVIEDDKDIAEMMSLFLRKNGYGTVLAYDSISGYQKAIEDKPDLILLDILLPYDSGYELCQTLKQKDKTKNIPIVLVSVLSKLADIESGYNVGADAYLVKPFKEEDLTNTVSSVLERTAK